jgi:hypothetical protein
MPSFLGHAETNGTVSDTNGHRRPETPAGRMALTDYSINPSPSSEAKTAKLRSAVPEDLLLPNGYPDVRLYPWEKYENQTEYLGANYSGQ